MSETTNAGTDYSGPGSNVNRDAATGIRYGVINQHSINQDALSDIWDNSRDLSYEAASETMQNDLSQAMEVDSSNEKRKALLWVLKNFYHDGAEALAAANEMIEDWDECEHTPETAEADKLKLWEVVAEQFNERYDGSEREWLYEQDGYTMTGCLQSDLFISKSPYYTVAQFCSPCVPGAGNLDKPMAPLPCPSCKQESYRHIFRRGGVLEDGWGVLLSCDECGSFSTPDWSAPIPPQTYCLGHEWFDGGKAPYLVYSVATGKLVEKEAS